MANSGIAVYDRNLGLVNSATLVSFIGVSTFLCDPQIQWVPSAQRWLFAVLYCNNPPTSQAFEYGWSKTSDPSNLATGWCTYTEHTSSVLFDYLKLGHNTNYLILGGNMYVPGGFVGATIVWTPLPANGPITTCPAQNAFTGPNPVVLKNGDGSVTFTPVPVNTYTNAIDGYILSAHDPSALPSGPRSKVAVWHVDSGGVLRAHNDVAVNSYDQPAPAQQLGTTAVLDVLDGRLTQAVGDPAAGMYTQHTVAGPGGRSEVHWYQFTVSGSTVVLAQQGSISSPTDWVFNAAISPRFDGQGAAIVYNRSSSNIYPLIAARIRYQATSPGTWAAGELVLASSPAPVTETRSCNSPPGSPCRWGDYAAASPDPVQQNLVWGTSEFNTASGFVAWSNQNFAIAPTPEAPTNVRASALRSNATTVSWTPAASDPGAPPTSFTVTAYIDPTAGPTMTTAGPTTTLTFTGLTIGVTYTFTVIANCVLGPSLESGRSNSVVSGDGALQSTPVSAPPARQPILQSSPAPPPPGR